MEKIKGLIIKDILQLKTYRRTIVLYIALFILSSFSSEGASQMLLVFMVLAFGMFAIASFNYDASSRADKYILSLPLTKKEVVKAKYIFVIMATLLGALIGIIIDVIITFVTQKTMLDIGVLLMTITTSLFGIALVQAVQIPFIYKLRTRKRKNSFDNSFCNFCFVCNWSFWYAENCRWT